MATAPAAPTRARRLRRTCALLAVLAQSPIPSLAAANEPAPAAANPDAVTPTEPPASGPQFEVIYKADLMQGTSHRIDRHRHYLGNLDIKLHGEAAPFETGTTRYMLHVLNNHGAKPNNTIGTAQGVSNIETPVNTTKLYQAWVEQGFADDRLRILFGLLDLNAEFYVTDSSSLFIHPAFGTGAELAQTGKNGPSVFPTTSLALRARFEHQQWYAQAAVFDGVPGSTTDGHGTHVRFDRGDGTLQIAETGYSLANDKLPGKLAVGTWRYTVRTDDLLDTDADGNPVRRRDRGTYLLFDYPLWAIDAAAGRGLNVFVRGGRANADVNQFSAAFNAGLTLRGLFESRPDDVIGIGIAAERNGRKYREASAAAGDTPASSEIAYEIDYRAQLTRWLALQPNLQYLKNHGGQLGTIGWLAGLRLEASLP